MEQSDLIDELLVSSLVCFVIVLIHNFSVEGGELFDRVVSVTRFEEPTAKLLFYQMLVAVKVGMLLLLCFVGSSQGGNVCTLILYIKLINDQYCYSTSSLWT